MTPSEFQDQQRTVTERQRELEKRAQAKHTPGPWEYDEENAGSIFSLGRVMTHIANTVNLGTDEGSANAALIAAAPELLEANIQLVEQVKQLLDQIEKVQRGEWKSTSICTSAARAFAADARAAIAKAAA